jgi:hypothetical protein
MNTSLVELLPEALELLVFGLGTVALSVVGAVLERFAFETVAGGQLALGAWEALMGVMAIYFAYLLLTDKCWPAFTVLNGKLRDA